jgi:hypothetical protein
MHLAPGSRAEKRRNRHVSEARLASARVELRELEHFDHRIARLTAGEIGYREAAVIIGPVRQGFTASALDGSSVSIADMPQQKRGSRRFRCQGEMHSRPQEISLLSATLGRNSILTWSQIMIKTPIAIAATAAVGLSFAQPALG